MKMTNAEAGFLSLIIEAIRIAKKKEYNVYIIGSHAGVDTNGDDCLHARLSKKNETKAGERVLWVETAETANRELDKITMLNICEHMEHELSTLFGY